MIYKHTLMRTVSSEILDMKIYERVQGKRNAVRETVYPKVSFMVVEFLCISQTAKNDFLT